ncbi:hypothetical protein HMPREF0731_2707, partial [Pseudoroseomonas cervicalis ATCC 49957]
MDQKRLLAAIAISIGILLAFDLWKRETTPPAPDAPAAVTQQAPTPTAPAAVA